MAHLTTVGNQCCDPSKNQKCVGGKCCSIDCTGKTCDEKNDCGELCGCFNNQVCYRGNCCTPQCAKGSCQDNGCGGTCPCPNLGNVCHEGKCCTPHDCSTGVCGGEGLCGQKPCKCNDRYCIDSCCQGGKCIYSNICESSPKNVVDYLSKQWGQFCQDSTAPPQKTCINCSLLNAQFDGDALAPVSGTISCQSCQIDKDTWNHNPAPININPDVGFYYNDNGNLTAGPTRKNFCSSAQQGCDTCICLSDDDCIRFGCKKCNGGQCQ